MKHYKLVITCCLVLVFIILFTVLVINKYGTNNIESMIELYSTNEVIVKTYENHNYNNYLMKMDKGNGYKELIRYMEDRGWKFVEQMGSGFLFTKDQQKLIVTTKMVTRYFIEIKIDKDII